MTKINTPSTPSRSHPARKPSTHPLPPTTPATNHQTPKARTPHNKSYTYTSSLAADKTARARAKSLVKHSDAYIYEMSHEKREHMLNAAAAEADAKRIRDGEHVSCLFEEEEVVEMPLSPEEAAEKWEVTKREIAAKVSGVRGVEKQQVRMLPKKVVGYDEKGLEGEGVGDLAGEVGLAHGNFTSKGIPVVMIDDD